MEVILAKPYGFCMGVKRAIDIAKKVRKKTKGEVNVLKEIVHNQYVVDSLKKQGIGSVSSLQKVKKGTIIFSAHGVGSNIVEEGKKRGLNIVDATCSLVIKVHNLVKLLAKEGYTIILIGDKNHDEIIGVRSEAPKNIKIISKKEEISNLSIASNKIVVITQTTLSIDDSREIVNLLKRKFPNIKVYNTICNATQLRQKSVKDLTKKVDLILVVGSSRSANSKTLVQVIRSCGKTPYLVKNEEEIKEEWFNGIKKVGITAGASTPNEIVENVIEKVKKLDSHEKKN